MLQENCFRLSEETVNEKSEGMGEEMGCAVVGCDVANDSVSQCNSNKLQGLLCSTIRNIPG
jgi:hypothetical protein